MARREVWLGEMKNLGPLAGPRLHFAVYHTAASLVNINCGLMLEVSWQNPLQWYNELQEAYKRMGGAAEPP
jgi:hypothetical protein